MIGDHPGIGPTTRYLVLADGYLDDLHGKMAHGILRFRPAGVAAVLDRLHAGRSADEVVPGVSARVPIVATLADGLAHGPSALLVAVTPAGGRLPAAWRDYLHDAIDAGLDVVAGMHAFLSDDVDLAEHAARRHVRLVDLRRPPEDLGLATGRVLGLDDRRVVLTVGTDAAVGKMTAGIRLTEALRTAGETATFVATGQTGILLSGWGVAIDRVIGDFMAGVAEDLVLRAAGDARWVIVEGQGSIAHPAFSSVTLALLHGAAPTDLVLCHDPGRTVMTDYERLPVPGLGRLIRAYEELAALVRPAPVRGIAVNTSHLPPEPAAALLAQIERETGVPAADVVRDGAASLAGALLGASPATAALGA